MQKFIVILMGPDPIKCSTFFSGFTYKMDCNSWTTFGRNENSTDLSCGPGPQHLPRRTLSLPSTVIELWMLQFGTFLTYRCTLWDPDPSLNSKPGLTIQARFMNSIQELALRQTSNSCPLGQIGMFWSEYGCENVVVMSCCVAEWIWSNIHAAVVSYLHDSAITA